MGGKNGIGGWPRGQIEDPHSDGIDAACRSGEGDGEGGLAARHSGGREHEVGDTNSTECFHRGRIDWVIDDPGIGAGVRQDVVENPSTELGLAGEFCGQTVVDQRRGIKVYVGGI